MSEPSQFWFPTKRVGWGWGLPTRWQGWCVLAFYLALILGGVYAGGALHSLPTLFGSVVAATLAFILIVIHKGEPPR